MTTDRAIPISLVAHTVFCPRRAWIESVGESVDSLNIEAGSAAHTRVDSRRDERRLASRSVDVSHDGLDIVGRCDVVETTGEGLRVVEYKAAPGRRSTVVTEAQQVQLALQGMALEDAGHRVAGYGVHFTTSHRTVDVPITSEVRERARAAVETTRRVIEGDEAPAALVDDPRCRFCSHYSVCLPDERQDREVSRVMPSHPDGQTLHLTAPGSRAALRKGRLLVVRGDEELASLPVERVDALVVHGNVDVSSAALRELMWQGRTVLWCSYSGYLVGYARTARSPNGLARHLQHRHVAEGDMELAREFIVAKVANQATQLRRSAPEVPAQVIKDLRSAQRRLATTASVSEVLAVEGSAAAQYFRWFPTMLKPLATFARSAWPGRSGRGATDPLNVALNVAYGLLAADLTRAVLTCGLDPHAGFVHSPGRNKPALALDLMEQFRAPVADSAVITALNNGELRENMYSTALGSWRLRDAGRKAIVRSYERRVHQEFTHPTYGYKITWRRAMEVQARMVLGVIDGTQDTYRGIRVR